MELGEFVDYHNNVIDITQRFKRFYRLIIFIEFSFLSLLICVTSIQVTLGDDLLKSLAPLFHGMTSVLALLIYSYGGQQIVDSSVGVCDDYFGNEKTFILIVFRSQKPLMVESFVYQISLPIFSLIMSRAGSLITLLKSFL